jgi:glycosyltransferase involved in cell wall biosynthesis
LTGAWAFALDNRKIVPFAWQQRAMRMCDRRLGIRAARIANARGAVLLSYSYYAHSAFTHFTGAQPRILFQLHPHPASVREILSRERELHPDCAASLNKEWELALPETEFETLVKEVAMAQHWLVASSFTRKTLVEHGVPAERIRVIPYGADLDWFIPGQKNPLERRALRVLFVGTVGQRKGIKYLVKALEALPSGSVELTVCGRAVDNVDVLRETRVPVRFLRFPTSQELLNEFQAADLFVLPSLAEGFGHVLLEAMSCGLPVIGTSRTAALDLIRPGQEGFVIEPGNVDELSESIEYFLRNPEELRRAGAAARSRAEHFTWARFRKGVADAVSEIIAMHIANQRIEIKAPQIAGFPAG